MTSCAGGNACPQCAAVSLEPAGEWSRVLYFVRTVRRHARFVETLWQCPACDEMWTEKEMKSTGRRLWARTCPEHGVVTAADRDSGPRHRGAA